MASKRIKCKKDGKLKYVFSSCMRGNGCPYLVVGITTTQWWRLSPNKVSMIKSRIHPVKYRCAYKKGERK